MNDILQQIMNMIENTRTVPSISSFSMIGFTVLLIFGVINCILGYRLLRFWMMLCGFVIGAGIGFGAAYTGGVTEKYMYAVFMVGAGVLLAVIAFVSYKIGIFILGAGIGIGLATGKATESIARQPEAKKDIRSSLLLGCALAEATAIYGLIVAILIIFFLK